MAKNFKVPLDELSGTKKLDGTYNVSFNISVDASDDLALSDIIHGLADGFEKTGLSKIADVKMEKLNADGSKKQYNFKVGDKVRLDETHMIKAPLYYEDGYYSIGNISKEARLLGEVDIEIPAGSEALVNKLGDHTAELIDFDTIISVPCKEVDTDEFVNMPVSIDLLALDQALLSKAGE